MTEVIAVPGSDVEEEFIDFAKRVENPVVCDIGSRDALNGIFLYHSLKAQECHVFEPNPSAIETCKGNITKLGREGDFFFNPIGLSDSVGTATFFPVDSELSGRGDIGFSSMYKVNARYMRGRGNVVQKEITIQTSTLDEYFAKREKQPDILWIDVGGAELRVFKGGEKTLEHVKIIHVEVSFRPMHVGKPLFWEVDKYLKDLGFKRYKFMGVSKINELLSVYKLLPNLPWRRDAVYYRP